MEESTTDRVEVEIWTSVPDVGIGDSQHWRTKIVTGDMITRVIGIYHLQIVIKFTRLPLV